MKKITLFCLLSICFFSAAAQSTSGTQLSIGADIGAITGTLGKTHNAMFGGALQVAFPLNKKLYFTIAGGYNYFSGKMQTAAVPPNIPEINYTSVKSVPAKLGLKYYLSSILFAQGEAGAAFFSGTPRTSYEAGTAFIYSPQIGVELPLGSHHFITSIRYESTFPKANSSVKVSFVGLHAGFGF